MSADTLHIIVVVSLEPRQWQEVSLQLPIGSTVADAVRASGVLRQVPDAVIDTLETGVWGQRVPPGTPLRESDRVELYRALRVDPKVARRERFARQGTRGTGLFARRRQGPRS